MSIVLPPPTPAGPSGPTTLFPTSLHAYASKDPTLLWPLRASSRREDMFRVTPPRSTLASIRRQSMPLDCSSSGIDYHLYPNLVEYILTLADHETRIRCRLLSRDISEMLDYTLGHSVILSTLQIAHQPAVVLRSRGHGRLPGLPPQSYDPDRRSFNVACFHPEVLRHTRVITAHNPLSKLNVSDLIPHLPHVDTVRDTFPGSRWTNPIPCRKYVTLTHVTDADRAVLPYTSDGVIERVINISCGRDTRSMLGSKVGPFRLSPTVRRVVVILNFPPIVPPELFAPLAMEERGLGVLEYLAREIVGRLGEAQFIVVGHDVAPPPVLGIPHAQPIERRQLEFDLYQRILARSPTNDFEMYSKLKKALRFLSMEEYRAKVGEERFAIDVIGR